VYEAISPINNIDHQSLHFVVIQARHFGHKPARISVGTTKGWVIGAVDEGTELAIQQATS